MKQMAPPDRTRALVRAVLRALRDYLVESGQLSALDAAVAGPVPEECFVTPEDAVNGGFLSPDRVASQRLRAETARRDWR